VVTTRQAKGNSVTQIEVIRSAFIVSYCTRPLCILPPTAHGQLMRPSPACPHKNTKNTKEIRYIIYSGPRLHHLLGTFPVRIPCVRNGQRRYLEKYLERGENEERVPKAMSFLEERGIERSGARSLRSKVNCCVKKKALTMYIDALYRGVGQNTSTPEKYRKPVRYQSDDGENQRQARQARQIQTQAKERERTLENQRQEPEQDRQYTSADRQHTSAHTQFPHYQSTITNPQT
jgi:hypothetical protein